MKIKGALENYTFVLPAVTIFAVFYIIPFIWVFQLGLFDWDGISFTKVFVGLQNFKEIFLQDRNWWQSMWNASYITLIALTFQNILAFMLALACDREIRMKNFYRVIFFIPPVLSEVVVGMAWRFIINDIDGANIINRTLVGMGLGNLAHNWLSDPNTALTTVALVHCWKGFGWGFIMLLAGLQTIDRQLYEAARVDGAGSWRLFWNITVPMMVPVILIVVILTILGSMQVFVLILSLVNQGLVYHTEVPVTRILASMSGMNQFGYACAQAVIFGCILVAVSFTLKSLSNRLKQG